ncbi:MAG: hypothetical protein ACRC9P_01130, partial [Bacteroides sp.]
KKIRGGVQGGEAGWGELNEGSFRQIYEKKISFEEECADTKVLFLGSSHGAYGIDPSFFSDKVFNLCSNSQDLYYSYMLYKTLFCKLESLESLVLCYSVFSSGFECQKTIGKDFCAYFKHFFQISYKYEDDKNMRPYEKDLGRLTKKSLPPHGLVSLGYSQPSECFADYPASKRALSHMRENNRENDQFSYLEQIANLCKENNHQLIVLFPPVRQDYLEHTPDEAILFEKVFSLAKNSRFDILSLYASPQFLFEDFGDPDHLNLKGAAKLSKILDSFLTAKKDNNLEKDL